MTPLCQKCLHVGKARQSPPKHAQNGGKRMDAIDRTPDRYVNVFVVCNPCKKNIYSKFLPSIYINMPPKKLKKTAPESSEEGKAVTVTVRWKPEMVNALIKLRFDTENSAPFDPCTFGKEERSRFPPVNFVVDVDNIEEILEDKAISTRNSVRVITLCPKRLQSWSARNYQKPRVF
jgi:hypothetical protein